MRRPGGRITHRHAPNGHQRRLLPVQRDGKHIEIAAPCAFAGHIDVVEPLFAVRIDGERLAAQAARIRGKPCDGRLLRAKARHFDTQPAAVVFYGDIDGLDCDSERLLSLVAARRDTVVRNGCIQTGSRLPAHVAIREIPLRLRQRQLIVAWIHHADTTHGKRPLSFVFRTMRRREIQPYLQDRLELPERIHDNRMPFVVAFDGKQHESVAIEAIILRVVRIREENLSVSCEIGLHLHFHVLPRRRLETPFGAGQPRIPVDDRPRHRTFLKADVRDMVRRLRPFSDFLRRIEDPFLHADRFRQRHESRQ